MTRGAEVLDMVLASVKIRPSAEASGMVLDKRANITSYNVTLKLVLKIPAPISYDQKYKKHRTKLLKSKNTIYFLLGHHGGLLSYTRGRQTFKENTDLFKHERP
jgi:hypothetical protein